MLVNASVLLINGYFLVVAPITIQRPATFRVFTDSAKRLHAYKRWLRDTKTHITWFVANRLPSNLSLLLKQHINNVLQC
jgi:hypothetical protein